MAWGWVGRLNLMTGNAIIAREKRIYLWKSDRSPGKVCPVRSLQTARRSLRPARASSAGKAPGITAEVASRTASPPTGKADEDAPPPEAASQDGSQDGPFPGQPRTLAEVGLSKAFLTDLTLKIMHYSGTPSSAQLMRRLGTGAKKGRQ